MREAQAQCGKPIVTQLLPTPDYYRETYHQQYYRSNLAAGYCMLVVSPKVTKFRKTFAAKRKKSTVD